MPRVPGHLFHHCHRPMTSRRYRHAHESVRLTRSRGGTCREIWGLRWPPDSLHEGDGPRYRAAGKPMGEGGHRSLLLCGPTTMLSREAYRCISSILVMAACKLPVVQHSRTFRTVVWPRGSEALRIRRQGTLVKATDQKRSGVREPSCDQESAVDIAAACPRRPNGNAIPWPWDSPERCGCS